jgi:tRNA(Ile)-lysidine synthase
LVELVGAAGIEPVDDPSNRDPAHDRVRFRRIVEQADWLDPARLSATASALRDADEALDWATAPLMVQRLERKADLISVDPSGLPGEIRRRLLLAALAQLGIPAPRGPDLARAMTALADGRTVTLADIKLEGGPTWRLSPAPPRRG